MVLAEAFDHPFFALRDQAHTLGDGDDDKDQYGNCNCESFGHEHFLCFVFDQAFVTLT